VEPIRLPPSSPDLNAFAERWVLSVKEERLSRLILFGEASLGRGRRARIRGKETFCSPSRLSEVAWAIAFNAGNVSEACSGTMHVPQEYFD
jgi:hypothetical protein